MNPSIIDDSCISLLYDIGLALYVCIYLNLPKAFAILHTSIIFQKVTKQINPGYIYIVPTDGSQL